jgi:transketolase
MIDRKRIYHRILDLAVKTGHAHLASSFSIVEILCKLYESKQEGDKIILSKGHGVYALYAVLMEIGVMPYDYEVKGHPESNMPGVYCSTGSLGHGVCIAVGTAMAKKIKNSPGTVYCIVGDGETEEGSWWESWRYAAISQLNNLHFIVDNNESRFPNEYFSSNISSLENKKGWPSRIMMKDFKSWHHKIPNDLEIKELRNEIDNL